jgi:hypothetical protein
LYLLAGLIVAVAVVVTGFRRLDLEGPPDALVVAVVELSFWMLYVRIVLETLFAIFRIADAGARLHGSSEHR